MKLLARSWRAPQPAPPVSTANLVPIDVLPDAVVLLESDGTLRASNAAARSLLGGEAVAARLLSRIEFDAQQESRVPLDFGAGGYLQLKRECLPDGGWLVRAAEEHTPARSQEEILWEVLAATLSEGLLVESEEGTVVYANGPFGQLLRPVQQPEVLVGREVSEVWRSLEANLVLPQTRLSSLGTPTQGTQERLCFKDGRIFWYRALPLPGPSQGKLWVFREGSLRRSKDESVPSAADRIVKTLTTALPMAIYLRNAITGRHSMLSGEMTNLLGYREGHLDRMSLSRSLRLVHPEDRRATLVHLQKVPSLDEDTALDLEVRLRHADGTWRWFLMREALFSQHSGQGPTLVLGIVEDVTERHRYEETQRLILSGARCVLWSADVWSDAEGTEHWVFTTPWQDLRRTFMGAQMESESVMEALHRNIPLEDRERMDANARRAVRSGLDHYENEFRWIDPQGRERWLLEDVHLEVDEPGRWHAVGVVTDLTERHRIQEKLRESELRLRAVMNAIPDLMFLQDSEGNYLELHVPDKSLLIRAPEEFIGKNMSEILPKKIVHRIQQAFLRVREDRQLQFMEYALRIHGEVYHFEARIGPCGEENFLTIVQHVSERKRAEEAIKLRDRAIQSAHTGIAIADARYKHIPLVYVNPSFEQITGFNSAEILGKPANLFLAHETKYSEYKNIKDSLLDQKEIQIELKNKNRNGDLFWNELHITPIKDEKGQTTHYIVVQSDITNRKNAENELAMTYRALAESEARLRVVMENLPVIVFGLDMEGVFTFSEGKGLSIIGCQPGGAVGMSLFELLPDPTMESNVRQMLEGKLQSWSAEVGETTLEIECTLVYDDGGSPIGVIGVAFDRTEEVRLQQQMIRNDKLAALGGLVAGVAHEINNPLAVIGGTAQLLERNPDPQIKADARSIRSMTERATKIVRSLLTFARGHGGENRKPGTLRPLVEETLELLAHRLRKEKVELTTDFSEEEPSLLINRGQIQQVILNLVTNAEHALHSRPEGERRLEITIRTEASASIVSIKDSGGGIPAHVLPRIFDPFFTTKDVGEGTGMGLSICHGIVESHGGDLSIDNAEGSGATFHLRLPRLAVEEIKR